MRHIKAPLAAAGVVLALSAAFGPRLYKTATFAEADRIQPALETLTGAWRLTEQSVGSAAAHTGTKPSAPQMILKSDGTATLQDFPIAASFLDKGDRAVLYSGGARWKLEKQLAWTLHVEIPDRCDCLLMAQFATRSREDSTPQALSWPVGDLDSTDHWTWTKDPGGSKL
ncbi:MAG: hypothetical protein FD126_1499 [Elusimicrobia bacterium]|nr:MAG: hypothetical protein FD126_1499 [Elusimicrobiota bacterium]